MYSRNSEDWDLCWYSLSGTGCRNSNCTWRHENSAGRFNQHHKQGRGYSGSCDRGDPGKQPGAPFYPIREYKDGGIEDQYGLVHYPEIENESNTNKRIELLSKRIELLSKLLCQLEPDYFPHRSTSMSISSSD